MSTPTTHRVLVALFSLSRNTSPIDAGVLGRMSGCSPTSAARALIQLEAEGLVDATRARLTLLGLAHAARLAANGGGGATLAFTRGPCSLPSAAAPLAAAACASINQREQRLAG
jgi:hypothetical protein